MRLIGRFEEQRELEEYTQSGELEFLVVYGRRRVGKTFLIREFFRDGLFFRIPGWQMAARRHLLSDIR